MIDSARNLRYNRDKGKSAGIEPHIMRKPIMKLFINRRLIRIHTRLSAFFLCSVMLVSVFAGIPVRADILSLSSLFSDVREGDWFYDSVYEVCLLGMMVGTNDGCFKPDGEITAAEAVTLLARMHASWKGSAKELETSAAGKKKWYQGYFDYCVEHRLYTQDDAEAISARAGEPVTRAELLAVFSALPSAFWKEINEIPDGTIPDVPEYDPFASVVYRAYRSGILIGVDEAGTFRPDSRISRAEVAAMVVRIMKPETRIKKDFTDPEITLYAADGASVVVKSSMQQPYLERGWRAEPYPKKSSVDDWLNAVYLVPTVTGYPPLDKMVEHIFTEIIDFRMTTAEKVRACYDYLVDPAHFTYGSSPVSGSYRPIYKKNPYLSMYPKRVCTPVRALANDRGYYYFQVALADHALEGYTCMYASELLAGKVGWCDHFSSAFAVMMRRIGLQCFPLYLNSELNGGYGAHMTTVMTIGGIDCIFDPQIEQVIYLKHGKNTYQRYGVPLTKVGDWYRDMDDLENCRSLFGNFNYDLEKMKKLLSE